MKKFPPEKMSFEEFLTKYRRVVGMVFLVGLIEAYNLSFMAYIDLIGGGVLFTFERAIARHLFDEYSRD
tara:strand:+ start:5180 stop:5386 length:207 start_codon:yes stop_codon:yes gene_type:complete